MGWERQKGKECRGEGGRESLRAAQLQWSWAEGSPAGGPGQKNKIVAPPSPAPCLPLPFSSSLSSSLSCSVPAPSQPSLPCVSSEWTEGPAGRGHKEAMTEEETQRGPDGHGQGGPALALPLLAPSFSPSDPSLT
jgi:hypothetical protein